MDETGFPLDPAPPLVVAPVQDIWLEVEYGCKITEQVDKKPHIITTPN